MNLNVTKPCEFLGFGAMEVTKPYEFIEFGAADVTEPHESIGFGATEVTEPHEFIGFGARGAQLFVAKIDFDSETCHDRIDLSPRTRSGGGGRRK